MSKICFHCLTILHAVSCPRSQTAAQGLMLIKTYFEAKNKKEFKGKKNKLNCLKLINYEKLLFSKLSSISSNALFNKSFDSSVVAISKYLSLT